VEVKKKRTNERKRKKER